MQLSVIQPPGKLESTLINLKMHYIHHQSDMDVTNQLWLGGAFSTTLQGPTPAALIAQVPAGILNPVPVIPSPGFVRPAHTRPSTAADDPNNYRLYVIVGPSLSAFFRTMYSVFEFDTRHFVDEHLPSTPPHQTFIDLPSHVHLIIGSHRFIFTQILSNLIL